MDDVEAQRILANQVPAVNLRYRDMIVVHNRRLTNISPTPSGSFRFLESAELAKQPANRPLVAIRIKVVFRRGN